MPLKLLAQQLVWEVAVRNPLQLSVELGCRTESKTSLHPSENDQEDQQSQTLAIATTAQAMMM